MQILKKNQKNIIFLLKIDQMLFLDTKTVNLNQKTVKNNKQILIKLLKKIF